MKTLVKEMVGRENRVSKKFVIKLVGHAIVNVVSIFFKGQNSISFLIPSHIFLNRWPALLLNE